MKIGISRMMSMSQSLQDGEGSPTKLFNSVASGLTPQIIHKYNNLQFEYVNLGNILSKAHSQRSHTELRFLSEFARRNAALKELTDVVGPDFSKGILRCSSLQQYAPGDIIEEKGAEIERLYIIFEGRLGVINNDDETDMRSRMLPQDVFQQLTGIARKQMKKINKLARKLSSLRDDFNCQHKQPENWKNLGIFEYFERFETFGDKARCIGETHTHTTIATQQSLLLVLDFKNLSYWLNFCFQRKLQQSFNVLRRHPCFNCLPQELLQEVVEVLSVKRVSKGDIIYQQGTSATHIFFLQEGEIKIQRTAHLFVQNPNELYLDRRKLMNESQLSNHEYLAYADLHLLYNYQPTNKILDLGILTPGCLFGQEEIIEERPRDTTTRCSTFKATYYKIELKKLFSLLGDRTHQFMATMKQSLREKIKYRQTKFANTINLENKHNLKYFYEGDSPTQRKKMVTKINQKLIQSSSPIATPNTLSMMQLEKGPKLPHPQVEKTIVPPSFNTFNFHLLLRTKLRKLPKIDTSSSQEAKVLISKTAAKEEEEREKKLILDSHTWRLVTDKVKKQSKVGKKLGTLNFDINFKTPLIDDKYFSEIESEMKRLQRQKKAGRLNTSRRKVHQKLKSRSYVASLSPRGP